MKLSIVIPAYNEARRLPATLAAISEYIELADLDVEVLVVDDGSSDGTAESVRNLPGAGLPPRIIAFEGNRGKGAAVREGMLAAAGDYVLFMDADHSTHITEVEKLLPPAKAGAEVVIGSRYAEHAEIKIKQPFYRVWISRLGNFLIRALLNSNIKDTQCGFKLFHRDAAQAIAAQLTMERFSFDIELLVIAKRLGYTITEVPVNWYDSSGTRLRPVRAALQTFRDLLRIRWNISRGKYQPAKSTN